MFKNLFTKAQPPLPQRPLRTLPPGPDRHVVGFPMRSGLCTFRALQHMHTEINAWLNNQIGDSWLIVRRGPAPNSQPELDASVLVVERGALIGTYLGREIYDYFICADGSIYQYTGVIANMRHFDQLGVGMRMTASGLLYEEVQLDGSENRIGKRFETSLPVLEGVS